MQLASQLDKASTLLETELLTVPRPANEATLAIGLLPIYFREFGTDIGTVQIAQAFARFDVRTRNAGYLAPTYAYQGLMRQAVRDTSILGRNGFIRSRLDLARRRDPARAVQAFHVTAVDVFLRNFILRAREFNRLVMLDSPFLFRASLITPEAICGIGEVNEEYGEVPAGRYDFGTLQISNLDVPFEQIIKPFCDQAHQMFGDQVSPCFDQDNHWRVQYG